MGVICGVPKQLQLYIKDHYSQITIKKYNNNVKV